MNQSSHFTGPIPGRRPRPVEQDTAGIAIFVVVDDEPIGSRILYVNEAFARMSGYTSEQLVGHSTLRLAGARPRREDLEAAIAARFPWARAETKTRPDGSTYRVEVAMEALPRTAGRPQHVVLTQRVVR